MWEGLLRTGTLTKGIMKHDEKAEEIEVARARGVQFGRPKLQKPEGYEKIMQELCEYIELFCELFPDYKIHLAYSGRGMFGKTWENLY